MPQSVLIVGAGIIGAATALQLAQLGCRVTVVSDGGPDATSASFGWINASFALDEDHRRLRIAGIAAWHRLTASLPLPVTWDGCICWDMDAAEMEQTFAALTDADYPVARLTKAQVSAREPSLKSPPDHALFFPGEGAAHAADIPAKLLRAAQDLGARLVSHTRVTGVKMRGDTAIGVETPVGPIFADQVILAAGSGMSDLAASAGQSIPMLPRPAYMLRTTKQPKCLHHILATPGGEIRQEPSGQILMPVAVSHQADQSEVLTQSPSDAADGAITRLKGLIAGIEDVTWAEVTQAARPVPRDERPVVGALSDGLYAAVMHSGITLGPVIAELIAKEVAAGPDNGTQATLAPYRPGRFQG